MDSTKMIQNGLGFLLALNVPTYILGFKEVQKYEEYDCAGIYSIDIRTSLVNVKISSCKGNSIQIKLTGTVNTNSVQFYTNTINGVLRINCDLEINYLDTHSDLTLEVFVPQIVLAEFKIVNNSSLIDFNLPSVKKLCLISTTGTIKINTVYAQESIFIKNTSGIIFAESIVAQNITISNYSGKIQLNNIQAVNAFISNNSGSTSLDNIKVINLHIKSMKGTISAIMTMIFDKTNIHTVSGCVSISVSQKSNFILHATTLTGNIIINDFILDGYISSHYVYACVSNNEGSKSPLSVKSDSGVIVINRI